MVRWIASNRSIERKEFEEYTEEWSLHNIEKFQHMVLNSQAMNCSRALVKNTLMVAKKWDTFRL